MIVTKRKYKELLEETIRILKTSWRNYRKNYCCFCEYISSKRRKKFLKTKKSTCEICKEKFPLISTICVHENYRDKYEIWDNRDSIISRLEKELKRLDK